MCIQEIWVPEIKLHTQRDTPIIIIAATKCDLCDKPALDAVMAKASAIGEEVGAVAVLSCSAKTGDGVAVRLPWYVPWGVCLLLGRSHWLMLSFPTPNG